jgi:hypothetical protein
MALRNQHDLELSTSSRPSVEPYDAALTLLAGYFVDPLAEIERALAEDPDFVSGHCLRAALGVLAAERAAQPLIRESVEAGERLASRANERERRHFTAARAWLEGDFHRAIETYGAIVVDYPRDLLALSVTCSACKRSVSKRPTRSSSPKRPGGARCRSSAAIPGPSTPSLTSSR